MSDRTGANAPGPVPGTSRADLHTHTIYGDGWIKPTRVIQEAIRQNLNVIGVTDHDHLEGAKRVEQLLAQRDVPLQLIKGVEVSTRNGHVLGLFLEKAPRTMRPVEESIDAIKEQGGLVIAAHPFSRIVPSLSRKKIDSLLSRGYQIDGIETYNSSPANARQRGAVKEANQEWGLAEVGGSDAHFWQHVGDAYTLFPGSTPQDVRQAILARVTSPGGMEKKPRLLNPGAYILQGAWSWFVDPPRRVLRRRREAREAREASEA